MISDNAKIIKSPQKEITFLQCPLDAKAFNLDGGIVSLCAVERMRPALQQGYWYE